MYRLALLLAGLVLAVDQLTKAWAQSALADGPIHLLGDVLSFQLVYNSGAAFSLGTNSTVFFTVFSLVISCGILWVLRQCRSTPWAAVLGIVLGGALGNFVDRLFRAPGIGTGHVVDFINYNGWFVGNVADIALVGGVVAVVVIELVGIPFRQDAAKSDE